MSVFGHSHIQLFSAENYNKYDYYSEPSCYKNDWKVLIPLIRPSVFSFEKYTAKFQLSLSDYSLPHRTAYKNGRVKTHEESLRIGTRYTALLEYSMDKDVIVMLARFAFPEHTSTVRRISMGDFRELTAQIASELQDMHSPD